MEAKPPFGVTRMHRLLAVASICFAFGSSKPVYSQTATPHFFAAPPATAKVVAIPAAVTAGRDARLRVLFEALSKNAAVKGEFETNAEFQQRRRAAQATGRSIASNNWRRLMPRRRISRLFIRSTAAAIAALHSAREKNVRWRSRPRM